MACCVYSPSSASEEIVASLVGKTACANFQVELPQCKLKKIKSKKERTGFQSKATANLSNLVPALLRVSHSSLCDMQNQSCSMNGTDAIVDGTDTV